MRLKQVTSLMDAVATAHNLAIPGDIVLLSPGCASFDQFSDFEERGQHFKNWVHELGAEYWELISRFGIMTDNCSFMLCFLQLLEQLCSIALAGMNHLQGQMDEQICCFSKVI